MNKQQNDYNLNIPRYMNSYVPAEHFDIYSMMFGDTSVCKVDKESASNNMHELQFMSNEEGSNV